jgi:hypothetical protein
MFSLTFTVLKNWSLFIRDAFEKLATWRLSFEPVKVTFKVNYEGLEADLGKLIT